MLRATITEYAPRGILIDTNVLLLYLVGLFDETLIQGFKRTRSQGYTREDFAVVQRLVSWFARVITTPQILAELSNLSFQMEEPRLSQYVSCVVSAVRRFHEEYVGKDCILASPRLNLLRRIGFTDFSIIEAAMKQGYLVLTDDFKAAGYLLANRCAVINLNQIRGERWLAQ